MDKKKNKKKRNEIRMIDVSNNTFDIVTSLAEREKRSNGAQAEYMIEELIDLKKLKPCK